MSISTKFQYFVFLFTIPIINTGLTDEIYKLITFKYHYNPYMCIIYIYIYIIIFTKITYQIGRWSLFRLVELRSIGVSVTTVTNRIPVLWFHGHCDLIDIGHNRLGSVKYAVSSNMHPWIRWSYCMLTLWLTFYHVYFIFGL